MSSQKSTTGKPAKIDFRVDDYFGEGVQMYERVTIKGEDGNDAEVLIATTGDHAGNAAASAVEYARLMRRIETAWNREISEGALVTFKQNIAKLAGGIVAENLLRIAQEQLDEKLIKTAFERSVDTSNDYVETLAQRYTAYIEESLDQSDVKEHLASLEMNVAANVLETFEQGKDPAELLAMSDEEYDTAYRAAYEEHGKRIALNLTALKAQRYAEQFLKALAGQATTTDDLLRLLNLQNLNVFTIATHPISSEIHKMLLRSSLEAHHATIRDPKGAEITVKTGVSVEGLTRNVATEYAFSEQQEVLESIQRTLLQVKRYGAGVLKIHLDLVSQAYNAQDPHDGMFYSFSDALERQGYAKNQSRRGFHPKAMQCLRERIITLQQHTIASHYTKHKGKEYLSRSRLWNTTMYHYSKQEPLPFGSVDDLKTLLRQADLTSYNAVTIIPGPWWKIAEMDKFRIEVPSSVLQLPTDTKADQYALQLATYLALHARRNQRQHAGKAVLIRVGTLLEESGITRREEFRADANAKRIRDDLLTPENTGALAVLHNVGAFRLDLADEDEFFAAGRGWKERFWNATIVLNVPDLKIKALTL